MTATLPPLAEITVPAPRPDESYTLRLMDRDFTFHGLKRLLAAADISKAGDRVATLTATDEMEREAARAILSGLTVRHLYDRPLTTQDGCVDAVMRVNYDIDYVAFDAIADMTLGALKDHLLRTPAAEVRRLGRGLTGVMAAALAKLMDVHELILVARKAKRSAKARTLVGQTGTLSSRLQPNHPTDDLSCVSALVYTGLSMGSGDALLGINPAIDTIENVSALLTHLDRLRRETEVPTQICVLAHVKTQMACLKAGAPVEIMFQSLAGTERTLTDEFDVTVDVLDDAYRLMQEKGPLRDVARQFMYFETGQGSELTYAKHEGMDMTTCEALCYGLARRYDPFMVNNVTGFIGPETHRSDFEMIVSNLQDHFMGKLMGLPMGMAPCYTLHSEISMEGHQIATELLAAAGANYFMDVFLTVDRMLAYFDTSGHDDQTLREIHNAQPAPEYLQWALARGIFTQDETGEITRGPNWGNPRLFVSSKEELLTLLERVPAAYGLDSAGPRPSNSVSRQVRANLAIGRQAIQAELDRKRLPGLSFRNLRTRAPDKETHLGHPDTGAALAEDSTSALTPEGMDVQIIVSDGLSAEAVHYNVPDLLPVLMDGLQAHGLSIGQPILLPHGRVKVAEEIGDRLMPRLIISLIGERPGGDANASRSLSAYFAYRLDDEDVRQEAAIFSGNANIRYEYSVVSNIHAGGLPPIEAGSVIVDKAVRILNARAAGNRLETMPSSPPAPFELHGKTDIGMTIN
ncbi:ethanolamine ammonia-lyase subunit EutB [Acetobacter estunensis]|uniref:ethanolamine ammonia-lyase subunit EutB n=1 Tax=Acetobacter estunensis TaxID=104097 RepID=UPI001C2D791B|nr:ethanolamine ammonia-lyase subunit EutB [Acetobacter estunensis]MBV1838057.1 ethanolamine ammonia-lyase [Acetobacter estunensis]